MMPRRPFQVGDQVRVIRTRHGWHDLKLEAVVMRVGQRDTGTWYYTVQDQQGDHHEVHHTRDMRLREA